ncbi:hypothetical protein ACFLTT_00280 [Chloroflexota bacterium]
MPGKPRHKKKFTSQGKKRNNKPSNLVKNVTLPEAVKTDNARKPVVSPTVSDPKIKLAGVNYPYIANELRTIGILAGSMLIILVILALILN